MAGAVKRAYHSPRRAEQARATRETVVRAAHELFLAGGYAATTIKAIADAAGVSSQTVYSQFGSKAAIVKEMLDTSIVGDHEPVPVAGRDWFTRVLEDGIDGAERLRRYAAACRRIYAGAGTTFEIVRRGADGDEELADVLHTNKQQRRDVVTRVVDAVAADSPLRVDRGTAIDLLWLLHGPEPFHALVIESRWDLHAYETWLADAICEQLLVRRA